MLGRQLTACDPAVCDSTDIPALGTNYTSVSADVRVVTNMQVSGLIYLNDEIVYSNYGCVSPWRSYESQYGNSYLSSLRVSSMTTQSVTTTTCRWDLSSSSVVTLTGTCSYARPGGGPVLAYNLNGKRREYVFSSPVLSGNYTQMVETTSAGPDLLPQFACCDPIAPADDVAIWGPGGTVSKSLTATTTSFTLRYAAVSTEQRAGITLVLTVAGATLGPWTVKVENGFLKLVDGFGTTITYSGTLSSVASTITASGNFTATVGTAVYGSVALTSDLKPYVSTPINVSGCSTAAVIVDYTDELTPTSCGCGLFRNTGTTGFAFDPGLGFADTKAGLDAFLASVWYPKNYVFRTSTNPIHYMDTQFDFFVLNPATSYLNAEWSLTPGASVQTTTINIASASGSSQTWTRVVYCVDFATYPFGCADPNAPRPVPAEYCNASSGLACLDCNGSYGVNCGPYESTCCCEHLDTAVLSYAARTVPVTQTLTGSFRLL